MTIKKAKWWNFRKCWSGTEAADVLEYLTEYGTNGYPVDELRACKCSCGSDTFELTLDQEEGCAQRKCCSCESIHFICDSEEFWDEASPALWKCGGCGGATFNAAVGYSLYSTGEDGEADVRYIVLGQRCVTCGELGCSAEWKVGYGPSSQLLEHA